MRDTEYLHPKQIIDEEKDSFRRPYEQPTIKEQKEMTFMFDAIEAKSKKDSNYIACRQCSSCHGCR